MRGNEGELGQGKGRRTGGERELEIDGEIRINGGEEELGEEGEGKMGKRMGKGDTNGGNRNERRKRRGIGRGNSDWAR